MSASKPSQAEVTIELLSQARLLSTARAAVMAFAKQIGFDDSCCSHIALAVDEAVCNIIRHGYGGRDDRPIWLGLSTLRRDGRESGISIVIEDEARQVEPSAIKGRNLEDVRPGGLGVHIIREVMEGVAWESRPGGGMRLRMSRRLPSAGGGRGISALPEGAGEASSAQSSVSGEPRT
jgi:anti-sigma regulatory factor (Ser/Thr protein kinase)